MKSIQNTLKASLLLVLIASAITACKKDDDLIPVPPPVENEGEVITTVELTFTDSAG